MAFLVSSHPLPQSPLAACIPRASDELYDRSVATNIGPAMSELNNSIRPIISVAITPKTNGDHQTFQRALTRIVQQDPTIRIEADPIGGHTIVSGMSEPHVESICVRIQQEHKIEIDIGEPGVLYLETIRGNAEAEGKYIRQTGGLGNYGHCKLRVEPNESGRGYEFINETKGAAVPGKYVKAIDSGVQEALEVGLLGGYPMVDVRVILYDSSCHEKDSNEMAFKYAGSIAFEKAARKASPVLLEPVMMVEVTVPEEFMGYIIADINSRRGRIEDIERRASSQVIHAFVPLSETLRSSTKGRPRYSMKFARYEPVPFHEESENDGAGDTAVKPRRPKRGSGFAAAELDAESQ